VLSRFIGIAVRDPAPKVYVTLLLAGAGALVFDLLSIPVAWLSGSMIVVAIAALAGVPVTVPNLLRTLIFFVLGINIGAAVTPETVRGIATWPMSILILLVCVPIVSLACALPLIFWRGWKRDDALMASVPGALSLILALADSTEADVPRIAIVQAVRVAVLTAIIPPLIAVTATSEFEIGLPDLPLAGLTELAVLIVGGVIGSLAFRLIRFPAPTLIGPLVVSAVLHATDLVSGTMPSAILIAAFVALGASVGARFAGLGLRTLRRTLADALMTLTIGFAISVAFAVLVTRWLGFPFSQTLMAFSPGAFEVMVVMAFVMGVDAAYVGAHHTIRFFALALLAPVLFRRQRNARRPDKTDTTVP